MDYKKWLMKNLGLTCVKNLKKHGFDAYFADSIEKARDILMDIVASANSIGIGGSATIRSLGLIEMLETGAIEIYDHWQSDLSKEEDLHIRLAQGRCDLFLCSANAVSLKGEIINVDGIGNRTAAMSFGPKRVAIVAGTNKVTPDLESALRRVKVVAAPMRAKSLNMDTPCAEDGICRDCNSPQRICRITTILHRQPMLTPVSVVIVNSELGF
jgi:L-lactate utilization protein LutB